VKALLWTLVVMVVVAAIFWWDIGFWVYQIFDDFSTFRTRGSNP